jgi:hypothetical protein
VLLGVKVGGSVGETTGLHEDKTKTEIIAASTIICIIFIVIPYKTQSKAIDKVHSGSFHQEQ